jgi:uncharacterized protein YdhG (YjbR/CyaY superfamily)
MKSGAKVPATIDEYIAGFPPKVQAILRTIRKRVRQAAPEAEEAISYRMPAFRQNGVLIYFAAFQKHIGVFPPIQGDAKLAKELAPYAGEKGNFRFPYDGPMPYDLVERIVKLRAKQNLAKAKAKGQGRKRPQPTKKNLR